jgi:EmrB/QacA subfamily drug resistance transporter
MLTPDKGRSFDNARTLAICCTALFITTLDNTILNVALPSLQRDLHTTTSELQWPVDSYILVRASLLLLGGSLCDRFGRRRCFSVGLWVFVLFSAACAVAPSLGTLIVFRCIQGAGSALMTPASLGVITNTFTDRKARAQALGVWSASTGISTTAGPILGGILVQYFGWRSVFMVNVPIGLAALIGTRRLSESRSQIPRPFDLVGQALLCAALAGTTYALIQGPSDGWGSVGVVILLPVSVMAWLAFISYERRTKTPLLEIAYFRNPALVGAVIMAVVAFMASGGFLFYNTLFLQEVRGFLPLHAGLLTIPTSAAALVLAPIAGRVTGTRGPRLPASVGGGFIFAATALLAIVIRPGVPISLLLIAYLLLGVGTGFVNPPITNAAVAALPADRAGVAGAITSTSRQVGTNLGVALVGSVVFSIGSSVAGVHTLGRLTLAGALTYTNALKYGYGLLALLALCATVIGLWSFRRIREDEDSRFQPSKG